MNSRPEILDWIMFYIIDHKLRPKLTKREYLVEIKLIKLLYGFRNKI